MSQAVEPVGASSIPLAAGTYDKPASAETSVPIQRAVGNGQPALEEVEAAVQRLNEYASAATTRVSFSVDPSTHQVIVRVLDSRTGEAVRQIPPEVALRIAAQIRELVGTLFDQIV